MSFQRTTRRLSPDDEKRLQIEHLRREQEQAAKMKQDLEATMRVQATRGDVQVRRGRDGVR